MMEDEDPMVMESMDHSSEFGPLTSPASAELPLINPHTPLTPATPKTPTPILSGNAATGVTDLDKANSVHSKDEDEHSDDDLETEKGLDDDKVRDTVYIITNICNSYDNMRIKICYSYKLCLSSTKNL